MFSLRRLRATRMRESGALRVWESEGGHLQARDGRTPAVGLAELPDATASGTALAKAAAPSRREVHVPARRDRSDPMTR